MRSVLAVIRLIVVVFVVMASCPSAMSGELIMSKGDSSGYIFFYATQTMIQVCQEEIRKTGVRGTKCNGLSIPLPAGTKADFIAQRNDFVIVKIKSGKHAGEIGLVSGNCYLNTD